ncbi:MAG: methyltransferase domain-containing protein [Okeania sp. SIO2G4]|uniref:methyltransferase domain-containing protein n=1 Tax=unclassified Okeania TaxID=2634635 RepID=UPI0013B88E0B|nr:MULTISPECIES: methyltransferase domain-containing protein [unclassified Okeania]NEP07454.1 methyltransferase domain-containing protein [Okeania sp. SIO4D6]NEP42201.1 methyltransferase domain-containing protein [Okeania sp. SIO2H7]NEP74327.1 methyltransferase domain-containing protein [Okeania sp. SIO2G5]NEP95403.1 methyltransferase domain-containing protein [Okeania sp. SIO2F5]NEQ93065.1 methyltransferase domain-containing protein [Okeania sp. SIO2G4]
MTDTTTNEKLTANYNIENAVLERYQAGAQQVQPALCCPTKYEENYLDILPQEIIQKDYGCGDPTLYISPGETVVDLGSGAGKNCYIIAQKVGAEGQVIGVDFNDDMLGLARKYQNEIATKVGYHNTKFVKGKIQDLALDLDIVEQWLMANPITSIDALAAFESECNALRKEQPLIPDNSVDVVISNCVLNLVRPQDKEKLFSEIYRVLKRGGRAIISDIVCDEDPTPDIINDPELWSGCIAGAFREDVFLKMFEEAGFYGVEILKRQEKPWQVIDGIEFNSVTVRAFKGKEGECLERNQAVIYKGPWKQVVDDDGHTLYRGQRMAVCDKTFKIYTDQNGPYYQDFLPVEPYTDIPLNSAQQFDCRRSKNRHPKETKGLDYRITSVNDNTDCCSPSDCG